MPFINVKIAGHGLGAEGVASLQRSITALMEDVLRKRPDLTAVLVEEVASGAWSVGGAAVSAAAHVEAKVTEGTNTAEEKARFVEEAHALLGRLLPGPLPNATYVVVHELPGDAWGYGGLTQAHRARVAAAA